MINAAQGIAAVTALGVVGILFSALLLMAVVAGLYERARIDASVPLPAEDVMKLDTRSEGFTGRHPSQAKGSAIIPAVPNDPRRQAHTRLQVAGNLREAASNILDTHQAILRAEKHDRYLATLFDSERSKLATSIVRRELAVIGLLTLGGAIAVWGLR